MSARKLAARVLLAALATLVLSCAAPQAGQAPKTPPAAQVPPAKPAPPPPAAEIPPPPAAEIPQPRLVDFIAPPGTQSAFQPFMLHADLWVNLDQRAKLDTTAYALENGARCCRVVGADSVWAVDYTWIYPHSVFPPRWYDARELMQVADSIAVPEDAVIQFTFGTCRVGVRAGSYEEARAVALRQWPPSMPERLAGRLRLKLDRARKALRGEPVE